MKRIIAVIMLSVSVFCLVGCDFLRKIAGGPTSAEIAEKKALLEMKAEPEVADIPVVNEGFSERDSLEAVEFFSSHPSVLMKWEKVGRSAKDAAPADYCVVIGSFGHKENAVRLADRVAAAGYDNFLFPCSGYLTAVGVSPTNSLVEAYQSLAKLLKEEFCPADAWILDAR